ncbi:MAG: glycerate kinase, partial [Actinomyces sp.]|nr:glycerate kinase [Actinomyces sp.]
LTQAFAHRPLGRRQLIESSVGHPARGYGSGAGGGVGAIIAASGGRIVPTGVLLDDLLILDKALESADLVIVAEPELASPLLATSTLDSLTSAAAVHALPVVGCTVRSSLSHVERAEWGLHGVFETEARVTLREAGRRIARTWLR